ncbi:type II toxin-antitoxin system VapC family toxin [Derxia lacustris]|uniref:type II toxin-antitoxin system VapC family toxin n=1 Tax=Derxia lacustris TaxID=764842 RepID=UPI000A16FE3E|nr:PIN domain-containing protein [Derxia lacustris]
MKRVLVDTSVWVDHFRRASSALADLLERDALLIHPMVLGELACGTPPRRVQTLADLGDLRQAQQASLGEVIAFVEREQLYGLGCGLVDLTLLASTLITPGAELWTLDRRLAGLASRFGVRFDVLAH